MADEYAEERLALVQEGGYSISHVGYAMLATIQGVLGHAPVEDPFAWMPEDPDRIVAAIDSVVEQHEAAGSL